MSSSDSIEFFANYVDWVESHNLEVNDSTKPEEVAHELAAVREAVDKRAFVILGIDTKALDLYSEKLSKQAAKNDYKSLAIIYKALGSAEPNVEIEKAAKNSDQLKPFAKVYLLRAAAKRLGLNWYVPADNKILESKSKANKTGTPPYAGVAFMAKYKDWISIKKLSIDKETKPEEVAVHLTSIRMATDRKLPQILGINTEELDLYANDSTNNMRKSVANLEKIVDILCSDNTKKTISKAIPSDSVRGIAVIYLFGKMLQNIKMDLDVSSDTLVNMFPGLKIPKPKGRIPGQKKKLKK